MSTTKSFHPTVDGFLNTVGPAVSTAFGDDASLIDWLEVWRTDDAFAFNSPAPHSPQHDHVPISSSILQDDLPDFSSFEFPSNPPSIVVEPLPTLNFPPTYDNVDSLISSPDPQYLSNHPFEQVSDLKEFLLQELEVQSLRRQQLQQTLDLLNSLPPSLPVADTDASTSTLPDSFPINAKRERVDTSYLPNAKHTSLTQSSLQSSEPPQLRLLDTPDFPFPKYAQRNKPITPLPRLELVNFNHSSDLDIQSLGIYAQVSCLDTSPMVGFLAEISSSSPQSTIFEWPKLSFPTTPDTVRNRGARVHPGEQKFLSFRLHTQHANASTPLVELISPKNTSVILFDHSKWFPSPEISIIANPVVEVGQETEILVYGQWFLSHEDETSNQGRLKITILDMDGLEQKVNLVKPVNNHHFTFTHRWAQPCTVWVQVHNEFKHRSSFKIRQSPRRTHQSTILVVPDKEAYFAWVRASTTVNPVSGSIAPLPQPRGNGASPNTPSSSKGFTNGISSPHAASHPPEGFFNTLHAAARCGEVGRILAEYQRHPHSLFLRDPLGRSLLFDLVTFSSSRSVEKFLASLPSAERRCLMRQHDHSGMTCLHRAILHRASGVADIVRIFSKYEPDLHSPYITASGFSPVHACILRGNREVLHQLLSQLHSSSNPLRRPVFDGWSIFHLACISNQPALIHPLLPFANIDALDYNDETPLFIAARTGSLSLLSELLRAGASQRRFNSIGEIVFDVASPKALALLHAFSTRTPIPRALPPALPPLSDHRVRLVSGVIKHITKKYSEISPERPNSFGRRNLSAPDLAELYQEYSIGPEIHHVEETIPISTSPPHRRQGSEPSCTHSRRGSLSSLSSLSGSLSSRSSNSAYLASNPSGSTRGRSRVHPSDISSPSSSSSSSDRSHQPDLQIAPIPSLFSLLSLSPRARRSKTPEKNADKAQPVEKSRSNPFIKLFGSRKGKNSHLTQQIVDSTDE